MPQVHLFETRDKALDIAREKLYQVEDRVILITNAHLIVESLLFRFVCSKVPNPEALRDARLTFVQIHSLARALRPAKESEAWFWRVTRQLNSLRNILAHNLEVADVDKRIDRIIKLAGSRIDIHAPGADPLEREEKAPQIFFIILCGVAFNLTDENFGI